MEIESTFDDWFAAGMPELLYVEGKDYGCDWSCFTQDLPICGCGQPWVPAKMLLECLRVYESGDVPDDSVGQVAKIVGSEAGAHFVISWMDHFDWLEHGGSTFNCWITDKGRKWLKALPRIIELMEM